MASDAESHLAEHFSGRVAQDHAARLGMWIFLSTEVLLFAGLFVAYSYYRVLFPETFRAGSNHLYVSLGTINTFLLVTSSFTVALAYHHAKTGRRRLSVGLLVASIALGAGFLGVKAVEYSREFAEGALPGSHFHMAGFNMPAASLFYTLYYLTTGLHAIHVTVGLGVLAMLAVQSARGKYTRAWHTPVELGAMYWHLVDLVWLFLYPLLYLVDRSRV